MDVNTKLGIRATMQEVGIGINRADMQTCRRADVTVIGGRQAAYGYAPQAPRSRWRSAAARVVKSSHPPGCHLTASFPHCPLLTVVSRRQNASKGSTQN